MLGITQAAVSYYASEKRGDETLVKKYPDVDKSVQKLGEDMCSGLSPPERQNRLCGICRDLQNRILNNRLEE